MHICVVGAGHVGLVTAGCFADLGHDVLAVDNDASRIEGLRAGRMPFFEPGLDELVGRVVAEGRLQYSTVLKDGIEQCEVIFIAVGTPQKDTGEADLTYVESVAREIAKHIKSYRLIVEKSTVPVQTGRWIAKTLKVYTKRAVTFDVASNPEFLREGSAIHDFMHPDRVVVGCDTKRARELLLRLYRPLNCPMITTDIESAEIIKHASNSFLAMKISFMNAVAEVCERAGADALQVADGLGMDARIGRSFLNAGIGYGGFCFPKDVDAFIQIAGQLGYDFTLLKAVKQVNEDQKRRFVQKIRKAMWVVKGKVIAVLGLSFKPATDDMRFAPAAEIIQALQADGAKIRAYDPEAVREARSVLKNVTYCKDPYEAARGADALVICTEWNEFKELDLGRVKKLLKQPLVLDGRNIYDAAPLRSLGFRYIGMGYGEQP